MTVLNRNEWEDILLKLPAHKIYDEFNESRDDNYCNTYFQEALNLERNYPEVRELCVNFAGIMKRLTNYSSNKSYITERCKLLNFWLYHKISKNFSKYMNDIFNDDIVWAFTDGWDQINATLLNNYCSSRYEPKIRIDDLNDYKEFYDYIKNQENIYPTGFTDMKECNKYYSYVSYINNIYERNKKKCCDVQNSTCNMFYFDCSEKYVPQKLMDQFNCDTYQRINEPSSGHEGDTLAQENEADQSPSRSRDTNSLNSDTPATPVSKAAMSVAFPMIGIFFIYPLIHKFTPFGSWLQNKVLRKKVKFTNELQDEYHEKFLGNEPITTDVNSQNDVYNIAYY
ncbi:PIR protein [Plasmodium ovale]|uniref:PIR Superfamily Protein n=2 Tax=Plasmodium ovale TaxID=36330 RepID=A0A1A8WHZ7_PLAOA|nr:PIR Superfamily Protein [Plasmodium ovale curtisi]SBS99657.1 PIR Superfamily Protein [Plasmodium ovale curtisi]SBT85006.1 PIR protein [Plasmodium ovale]